LNILVLGIDGYIGWPLAMHLAKRGHKVSGIDNLSRRVNVNRVGSISAIPIRGIEERTISFNKMYNKDISFYQGDILEYDFLCDTITNTHPHAIVHLAEQPSAPFSMIDRSHANYTHRNNVEGTLNLIYAIKEIAPESHLIKLGTMGEYGYDSDIDIPEGFFNIEYKGRRATLPFPRQPGSMYHLTKVHDSANTHFACRLWGLRATDVMQGVVYGTRSSEMIDDTLLTRFDFDESFGTVLNRYCAEAVIGHPLTPYGQGKQKRGFIDLIDSIQCLTIAIEQPAARGEYRVFNQLDEVYSVTELAEYVVEAGRNFGLDVKIGFVQNPRKEKEHHYYNVEHENLKKLGFKPTRTIMETLHIMLEDLLKYKDRIMERREVILPKTRWVDNTILMPAR
jgi:UDP-sulfoquinovose synthase